MTGVPAQCQSPVLAIRSQQANQSFLLRADG
jgi:hypothetical protein